jgi:hypothetical protein
LKFVAQKTERQTVVSILQVFSRHDSLVDFFFEKTTKKKIRFRPDEMRLRIKNMPSNEQLLIRIALDIWSGSGNVKVWELLEVLDGENFAVAMNALLLIKSVRTLPGELAKGFSL